MARISPEQLDVFSGQVSEMYTKLELEIFNQIAKRLKFKPNEGILEWQARAMNDLNLINNVTIKELSKLSGVAVSDIKEMFEQVGYQSIESVDKYLTKADIAIKPKPTNIDNMLKAYQSQMFGNMDNFVNQSLITTAFGSGTVERMYTEILNEVQTLFNAGFVTKEQALTRVMDNFARKGLESGYIDASGRRWSVDSYVRNVLKSTLNNTYNDLRTNRMFEHDVYTVLMTSIPDAADRCINCQGKVLDMRNPSESEYPSIYDFGYKTAGGTLGSNCRHDIIPFIPGVNSNNQQKYGKIDTRKRNEERMRQRSIERSIRDTKKRMNVAKELDVDKYNQLNRLLKVQQKRMRDFLSDKEHLSRDYNREQVR